MSRKVLASSSTIALEMISMSYFFWTVRSSWATQQHIFPGIWERFQEVLSLCEGSWSSFGCNNQPSFSWLLWIGSNVQSEYKRQLIGILSGLSTTSVSKFELFDYRHWLNTTQEIYCWPFGGPLNFSTQWPTLCLPIKTSKKHALWEFYLSLKFHCWLLS